MRRFAAAAVLMAAALVVSATQASAQKEKRVALVIGNAAYKEAPLKNPVNDARMMAAKLKELGFDIIARENTTLAQFGAAVAEFASRLTPDTAALVYYAGHGVQSRGRNYLIPVDAEPNNETELGFQAVEVGRLTEELDRAQARVSFLVLDACRNNPFERRVRGSARGLAAVDAARGALIAYATAPGSVAADGTGSNGPYTEELAKALGVPNLKAEEVFKQVTAAVEQRTAGRQTPWTSSSLRGDFVFNLSASVSPRVVAPTDSETVFWQSAQMSNRIEEYEAYLKQFPNGIYSPLARARLVALRPRANPVQQAAPAQPDPRVTERERLAALEEQRRKQDADIQRKGAEAERQRLAALEVEKARKEAPPVIEAKKAGPAEFAGSMECTGGDTNIKYPVLARVTDTGMRIEIGRKSPVTLTGDLNVGANVTISVPEVMKNDVNNDGYREYAIVRVTKRLDQVLIAPAYGTPFCNGVLALRGP